MLYVLAFIMSLQEIYLYNQFSLAGISGEAVSTIAIALKTNRSLQTLK